MKRDLRLVRRYPYPPSLVWRALTDRELLAEWLMASDFQPELGRSFTFRTEPAPGFDGIVHCKVLELEAERRMRWAWRGGAVDTEVSFRLEPALVFAREGTELTVEQTGFAGLPAVLTSFILQAGNRGIYGQRLPAVVARLAGEGGGSRAPALCEKRSLWNVLAQVFAPVLRRGEAEAQGGARAGVRESGEGR